MILNIGFQDKAERVDNDVAFAPLDLLACVKALVVTGVRACLGGLTVDNRIGRLGVPTLFLAHLFVKKAHDLIP